ncbi:MAG: hypothetical protein QOF26_606 [Baekduia sp.]|nr:hypothetical protein [Baekduia sp.]
MRTGGRGRRHHGGGLTPCQHTDRYLTGPGRLTAQVWTAQAGDAGLKRTVKRYELRVAPLAKAFGEADKPGLGERHECRSVRRRAFRNGLHAYKIAIVPIKTASANSTAGKKQLLTAIRE